MFNCVLQTLPATCQWWSMGWFCGCRGSHSNDMELFISSSFSCYCSFLSILQNLKSAYSIKLSVYLFSTCVSCPSSLVCLQLQGQFALLNKLKEFVAIFPSLLEESFCTVLSRSRLCTALLFCHYHGNKE